MLLIRTAADEGVTKNSLDPMNDMDFIFEYRSMVKAQLSGNKVSYPSSKNSYGSQKRGLENMIDADAFPRAKLQKLT